MQFNLIDMKEIFFIFAILFVSCASEVSEPQIIPEQIDPPHEEPMESLYYENWATFEDAEMGVRFKYPSSLMPILRKEIEGDTGQMRSVSIDGFELSMTSKNFSLGSSEGCCFYYSDSPIDLSQNEMESQLKLHFERVFNIRKVDMGVRFQREIKYIDSWFVESLLIPYDHNEFTNILVSGESKELFEQILGTLELL